MEIGPYMVKHHSDEMIYNVESMHTSLVLVSSCEGIHTSHSLARQTSLLPILQSFGAGNEE